MIQTPRDAARSILATLKASFATPLEYVPAKAASFPHLDLPAYAAIQSWMRDNALRRLVDLEVPALSQSPSSLVAPTFTRAFLSADGTVVAQYYQVKPRLGRLALKWATGIFNFRWIAATRMALRTARTRHCTSFETGFSDGGFVITSNAESAGKLTQPPSFDVRFHPYGTTPARMLAEHRIRVAARRTETPATQIVAVADVRQMLAQQRRMAELKSAWRAAQNWISKAEIDALASNSEVADAVYEELQKLRREDAPSRR
jgi:hypothetical protein